MFLQIQIKLRGLIIPGCILSLSYKRKTSNQQNQFYAARFNIRVYLPIIKLEGNN